MSLPFAKYAIREVILYIILLNSGVILSLYVFPWASPVFFLALCFVIIFFRDPERTSPGGEEKLLAPADGTIVDISCAEEENFIKGRALKIAIFMSIFNVHVNRLPCSGRVGLLKHQPGRFFDARTKESSAQNECNLVGIVARDGRTKVLIKQIAGVAARRIICDLSVGQEVLRGERFGMIKFGSRVEVFIPEELKFELLVKEGQKVKAGETVMGILPLFAEETGTRSLNF